MDIRYEPGQPLQINLLASRELLNGRIVKLAGRMAIITVNRHVAPGAPLRIDFDDSMLLGEVWSCESEATGHRITVQVSDAVPRLSDLARLVSAVMSTSQGVGSVEKLSAGAAKA
jgi:hypothetical protein